MYSKSVDSLEKITDSEIDAFNQPAPTCPLCGYIIRDYWEYGFKDGRSIEIDCPNCDKNIVVTMEVEYTFSAETSPTEESQS